MFVTLNPANKEYRGRSKLPENLKQLLREVAMSQPDSKLISEVLLFVEGFKQAKQWAQKICEIFSLSQQLLTPQKHYDWGLRAIKTVLNSSGKMLREAKAAAADTSDHKVPEAREMRALLSALRGNTLAKLTFSGFVVTPFPPPPFASFSSLLQKKNFTFPKNVYVQKNGAIDVQWSICVKKKKKKKTMHKGLFEQKLQACVREQMKAKNLAVLDCQVKKVLELYEALTQRIGIVVIGPANCGKSTLWQLLQQSLMAMSIIVHTH
ncbi:cytoplasmic dynein heavy chain 1b, partial [Reticulomyxa filosa]